MTRYRYVLLFILCMILFPNISKAECSYERQAELSRIASNVQFSYSYEMGNSYPKFTVNITNVTSDIYIKDSTENLYIGNSEFYPTFSLPYYNIFSSYDECKKYPSFELCSLWGGAKASSENDFRNKLNTYVKTLEAPSSTSEQSNVLTLIRSVLQNKENYLYLILSLAGMFTLIMIFVLKKVRK